MPRIDYTVLGRFPLTSTAFHDFRTHAPRIRIDGLFIPPGRFFARVSASVATAEGCTGRGSISHAADTVFATVFAIPIEGGTGSAEPLAAATPIAQPTPLSRISMQETGFTATTGSTVSVSALLGTPAPRRRRCADEQRQQPVMHPSVDYRFRPGGAPRPSARSVNTPASQYSSRREEAESLAPKTRLRSFSEGTEAIACLGER